MGNVFENNYKQDAAYHYLAVTYKDMGNDEKFIETINKAREKYPENEFIKELDIRALSNKASETAIRMVNAGYVDSGVYPVIIDNGFGGVIFHRNLTTIRNLDLNKKSTTLKGSSSLSLTGLINKGELLLSLPENPKYLRCLLDRFRRKFL